ncbi:hypothetical protein HMPREF9466_01387 [Fusobacterium necrophorum subsp. funduliforme 1_1_36S]|nr:hypothetical protein HMPREF9466_01387 [Fusobacterium necrophorum subsp. funduliforme 1_1_36S]
MTLEKIWEVFATMTALNRIQVGEHTLKNAYTISEIHDKIKICDFSFCIPVEEYFCSLKYNSREKKSKSFPKWEYCNFSGKRWQISSISGRSFLGLGKIEHQRLKGYKYF